MFDKRRCARCDYGMKIGPDGVDKLDNIMCGRVIREYDTCLKMIDGQVVDTRGEDPKHCLLYKAKPRKKKDGDLNAINTI